MSEKNGKNLCEKLKLINNVLTKYKVDTDRT